MRGSDFAGNALRTRKREKNQLYKENIVAEGTHLASQLDVLVLYRRPSVKQAKPNLSKCRVHTHLASQLDVLILYRSPAVK